jgi:hypothetical protein
VAGVPAKIIRYRFDEATIESLLKSEWWKWDKTELLKYRNAFNDAKIFVEQIERK